jgi:hypothetical protein
VSTRSRLLFRSLLIELGNCQTRNSGELATNKSRHRQHLPLPTLFFVCIDDINLTKLGRSSIFSGTRAPSANIYPDGYWQTDNRTLRGGLRPHAQVRDILDPATCGSLWPANTTGRLRFHDTIHNLWLERYPWPIRRITGLVLFLHQFDILGPRILLCILRRAYRKLLAHRGPILSPLAETPSDRP